MYFCSFGAAVAPVVPHLPGPIVVPEMGLAHALQRRGYDAYSWTHWCDPAEAKRCHDQAAPWLAQAAERLLQARFPFRGRARPEMAEAIFRKAAHRAGESLIVSALGRSLVAEGLKGILLHEDVTPTVRALLSSTRGVRSVHVPHGLYADERVEGADVHGALHADLLAAAGPHQAAWFQRHGVDPQRIVITGNPAWDRLRKPLPVDTFPTLGPRPIVTIAASWLPEGNGFIAAQHRRWSAAILGGVARVRPGTVVMKLHPSAPAGDEVRLARESLRYGLRPMMVRGDALPYIAQADVVVTLPSTIAIEAMLLRVPVVCPEYDYAGTAVRGVPAEADAVARAIEARPPSQAAIDDFAERYAGPPNAAERVASLVAA